MRPAAVVHAEIVTAVRTMRNAEHHVCVLLREVMDAGHHEKLGYASVFDYAVEGHGLTPRKAKGLLRIARALPRFAELDRAMAEGRVDWSKARDMLRVLTPANEAAWIERAASVTNRDLEVDLRTTRVGELPPSSHVGSVRPEVRTRMVFSVDAHDAATLRDALATLRARLGPESDDVDDGQLLVELARRAMHDLRPEEAPTGERFQIVVAQCPECGRSEGVDTDVTDTAVLTAACDAEIVDLRPGPTRGYVSRTIPPAVRRAVLLRDGRRCRVPGCSNHLWVDVHHVVPRSAGGRNVVDNLVTLCSVHHRLVHVGLLVVEVIGDLLVFTFPTGRRVAQPPGSPRAARPTPG